MKLYARDVGECHVDGGGPVILSCQVCSFGISHILAHTLLCRPSCPSISIVVLWPPVFYLFLGVWLMVSHGVLPGFYALMWGAPRFSHKVHKVHFCSSSIGRVEVVS